MSNHYIHIPQGCAGIYTLPTTTPCTHGPTHAVQTIGAHRVLHVRRHLRPSQQIAMFSQPHRSHIAASGDQDECLTPSQASSYKLRLRTALEEISGLKEIVDSPSYRTTKRIATLLCPRWENDKIPLSGTHTLSPLRPPLLLLHPFRPRARLRDRLYRRR